VHKIFVCSYVACIYLSDLNCPPLEEPDNGTIACTRSGFVVGSICIVGCDDGFELIGSNIRTCLANQTWSGTEATCVELPGEFCCYSFNITCCNNYAIPRLKDFINSL